LPSFPRRQRLRLEREAYDRLRQQVLERDNWRCQSCGRRDQLEVHHKTFRSSMGDDSGRNLITLCHGCHGIIHGTIEYSGA
jgi:5-methylcytosine-specific restriction endonuclease McrA